MTFLEAIKYMDQNKVVVLDGDRFRINTEIGIIEEYVERARDWLPTILTANEYLSEDWELEQICLN